MNDLKTIYNMTTGEVLVEKMTQEELDQYASLSESIAAEEAAKEAARQAALEKLRAIGLTEEEVQALVGN